jgi:hypothetical protein
MIKSEAAGSPTPGDKQGNQLMFIQKTSHINMKESWQPTQLASKIWELTAPPLLY